MSIPATQEITPVSTEVPSCAGFAPDTYDRYVLGLLAPPERAAIDRQIERECPVCLSGVQRSMNLWLAFAGSLQQTEPSADFHARLVRIAELSNRVLTVPKRSRRIHEPAILIWSLIVTCLIVVILLVFTWRAGRQSARLDELRANNELQRLTEQLSDNEARINQQAQHLEALEKQTPPTDFREKLSKAQAEAEQYREHLERNRQRTAESDNLLKALTSPGARLLTFRNADGAFSTANAFVIEDSKLIFIASNLPPPLAEHQYQLWLVRKDEPRFVSAAVFSVIPNEPVVVTYSEDKDAIANLTGLFVTEESLDGSKDPTSKRVLETPGAASTAIGTPETY